MRLLFIGDVVGRQGRAIVLERLPRLINAWHLDCTIINGENAANGFGITEAIYQDFLDAGADCVTLGNHAFDQREALVFASRAERLVRPITFPAGTPGRGAALVDTRTGKRVLVINAMGRVFMDAMEDPFASIEAAIKDAPLGQVADAIVVDFHAEATSEKQALGHYLDGRVSLVVGTHTHVPTADHRVLPNGTAYQSDSGMTGDYDSVIGMDKAEPMRRFVEKTPGTRYEPAMGQPMLCGLAVEIEDATGLATGCWPVRLGQGLSEAIPPWGI